MAKKTKGVPTKRRTADKVEPTAAELIEDASVGVTHEVDVEAKVGVLEHDVEAQSTEIVSLRRACAEQRQAIELLTEELANAKTNLSALTPSFDSRIPPEVAAGVSPAQVYMSAVSGLCSGMAQKTATSSLRKEDAQVAFAESILNFAGTITRQAISNVGISPAE